MVNLSGHGLLHPCPVVAVALDVDGVLIDSAPAHRRVWTAWADIHGLDVEVVWRATFGRRPEETVEAVHAGLSPAVERRVLDELLAAHEHRIEAFDGAHALLEALARTPWAIVTSGSRALTSQRFGRLGLPLPPAGVFGEDVERGKPDPEGYLRACRQLEVAPTDCVVVEDAPAGIAAARAAGCWVMAVATTLPGAALGDAHEVHDALPSVARRLATLLSLTG
jgi:mannitol-1-/sugar-/sorbitol-6-phosphatase